MSWFITGIKNLVTTQKSQFDTGWMQIPGVAISSAYTAEDAFGTTLTFNVPKIGKIDSALFIDKDDEGIEMEFVLFNDVFVETVDAAAFAPSDADLGKVVGSLMFSIFNDYNANQISHADTPKIHYNCPSGIMRGQFKTSGTPNIAANNLPSVRIFITPGKKHG